MKSIVIKTNFELHEMVESDIKDAVTYCVTNEPDKNIRKSARFIRTTLNDFGIHNVEIYVRETESNIYVNLEKVKSYYELKEGDTVKFRGTQCKIDKVYSNITQLRIVYNNKYVLVDKDEVEVI